MNEPMFYQATQDVVPVGATGGPRITRRLPELPTFDVQTMPAPPAQKRRPRGTRPSFLGILLGGVLMLGMLLGGAGAEAVQLAAGTTAPAPAIPAAVAIHSTQTVADVGANTISAIYQKVAPSVVLIDVTIASSGRGSAGGAASGSGIVLDSKGDILTNNHVVAGATTINVKLTDGSVYPAAVVGTAPQNDLAVIRTTAPAATLVPATLGDSTTVQAGAAVIAVGYPYNLGETVTAGIVSGLNRSQAGDQSSTALSGLIQVDAAINPGNSGGALVNTTGQVIGISTMIESPVDGFTGVGLVIPINQAKNLIPQLEQGA